MASPSNTNKTYYDVLGSFELGVNSGVAPTLLPKNQLAWAINGTVRGGHIKDRPPFEKQTLNYNGNTTLQSLVESGYFQGAGVYRPDYGASQILAQIEGHLVCFTPNGDAWDVTDVSITGDLNVVGTIPVWMWQSEKWMIIQDGTGALPIFYDGTSSRRSNGPSELLGTSTAVGNFPNPRVIGEVITVITAAAWEHPTGTAGPFNVPVIFNGAFYQPIESPGTTPTYSAQLTNLVATAGATIPSGSDIIIQPSMVGYTTSAVSYATSAFATLHVSSTVGVSVGDKLLMLAVSISSLDGSKTPDPPYYQLRFVVTSVDAGAKTLGIQIDYIHTHIFSIASGVQVNKITTDPSVIVGTTLADFINPAVGDTVNITLTAPFTGTDGQTVWIGTSQYSISSIPPPAPTTTLYLVNLTDTTDAGAAIPGSGADSQILSVPELPAGRMGAYGMGRNWICLTDGISYVAGDIVGGAAGTQANNYRDSVLTTTENDYLAAGGTFRLPNSGNIITSMTFTANLDVSLGQGPLQIGTDSGFFSNQSPVVRATWEALDSPLQTQSLIGSGPLAQNSTIVANSDILFRSIDGIGSLIIARRNFGGEQAWSNTPISREVERALENDQKTMLPYSSAITFDNRLLMTCYPSVSVAGVIHQGLVALNFDLMSNLRGKAPPVYDGLWTGINTLQLLTGNFSGTGRAFAFGYNTTSEKIELYELLRSTDAHFDNGSTRIEWTSETASLFRDDIKPKSELIRLLDADIEVQEVDGVVDFEVQYKPDYYPCWTTWRTFQICADQTADNSKPGYRTRMSLGDPTSEACEANNNRPLHTGHFFEFRIKIVGHCKFMGMRVQATTQPESDFAPPICASVTTDTIPVP